MTAFDVELQKLLDSPTATHRPVPLAEAVVSFRKTLRKRGFKRDLADELTHLYLSSLLTAAEDPRAELTDDADADPA